MRSSTRCFAAAASARGGGTAPPHVHHLVAVTAAVAGRRRAPDRAGSPRWRALSTTAPPLRLGLVGCGRLAETGYAPAIAGDGGVELVAVADPRAERRDLIARLAGGAEEGRRVATHAAAAELLDDARPDAIIVASPPGDHLDHARLASGGNPVPGREAAGARPRRSERLAELGRPPWVGFNRRFQHGARLIEAMPAEGPLELLLEPLPARIVARRFRSATTPCSTCAAPVDLACCSPARRPRRCAREPEPPSGPSSSSTPTGARPHPLRD